MWVVVMLLGFLLGTLLALVMVVCGVVVAVRAGRRSPAMRLRAGALLVLGVAIGAYAWGMAHVGMAVLQAEDGGTDSSPLRPCRGEADAATVAQVVDYQVGLVPLRFECQLDGGGSYVTSAVPGYLNPVAGIFGVAGIAGIVFSASSAGRPSAKPEKGTGLSI
jgi:hypothetical protein